MAFFVSVAALLAAPTIASADEAAARAAELNRDAAEYAKHQEWDIARSMLAEAYRLAPDPSLLVNLAAIDLKSDHAVDALAHLRAYLADPHADAQVKQAVMTQLLPRAMAATGHLTIHFPAGTRVLVDGEPLDVPAGATATIDDVKAGAHFVQMSAGGSTTGQSVVVQPGQSLEMQPVHPEAPAPAPQAAILSPAAHDEPVTPQVPESGFWIARNVVPLGLIVGGVVIAGLGGYFVIDAHSKLNQADILSGPLGSQDACNTGAAAATTCQTLSDLHTTYDRDRGLAQGFFISGGALAAAGLLSWLLWPSAHAAASVGTLTVRPYATGAGAGLAGSF